MKITKTTFLCLFGPASCILLLSAMRLIACNGLFGDTKSDEQSVSCGSFCQACCFYTKYTPACENCWASFSNTDCQTSTNSYTVHKTQQNYGDCVCNPCTGLNQKWSCGGGLPSNPEDVTCYHNCTTTNCPNG